MWFDKVIAKNKTGAILSPQCTRLCIHAKRGHLSGGAENARMENMRLENAGKTKYGKLNVT